ncbi:BatD family protein [Arcobacter sp. CECT 8985]|uniref:BatD family protein n=1 Tax=Arcobacter sp. CECT 8985 TaxID=1935424 RepID=UPI00100A7807|nr:BatD family protein [Arcobacter sp. CECT 8985]RXJ87939.1 hypothetical protein CRU93_02035 [Arcobacter sp. CECT 8985]
MKLYRALLIIFIFINTLLADVSINAPTTYFQNEAYVFTIKATGSDVVFPKIDKISNQKVQTISTSKSIQIVNSSMKKSIIRKYRFFPKNDFVLPSFTIKIDGKDEKTKQIKVKKTQVKKSNFKYANLEVSTSKTDLYVGEAFKLKLKFKYLSSLNISNLSVSNVDLKDIWFKQLKGEKHYKEGDFDVHELTYLMFAQKSGHLKIEPFRVNMSLVAQNSDPFFGFVQQNANIKRVYSNSININVKKLPDNLNLIGHFDIKTSVDKTTINQGDSITYKVKISGIGNIDDIKDIKLNIKNAQVFENKPKISTNIKDSKYYGEYEKVFSIIPLKNINIDSIKLRYLDEKTKKVVVKSSDSFSIKVKKIKKQEHKLYVPTKKNDDKTKVVVKEVQVSSVKQNIIYFLLGSIFTFLIIFLVKYFEKKRKNSKKDSTIIQKIKKSKTKDNLIKILAVYIKKDEQLDKMIYKLQDENEDFKSLKKQIVDLIKQLEKGKK